MANNFFEVYLQERCHSYAFFAGQVQGIAMLLSSGTFSKDDAIAAMAAAQQKLSQELAAACSNFDAKIEAQYGTLAK